MEYFEAALNLPIIMFLSTETEAKLKKSKQIIRTVNITFYSILFMWAALF